MVAVREGEFSAPEAPRVTGDRAVPAADRRFVAVAVCLMELLRPESDLARLIEGPSEADTAHVDLLVATDDVAPERIAPLGVLGGGCAVDALAGADCDDDDDDADDDRDAAMSSEIARLGLPELYVHRLSLRPPLGPTAEDDLVAALSELVGFDPEPGVYLLGPAAADPAGVVVDRAVERIAQVYGIPLLRYRCHELTVVEGVPG